MSLHPELTSGQKRKINQLSIFNSNICCYIDKKPVSNKKDIEYHNIQPLSLPTLDMENFTVVCKKHHKEVGELSIIEYLTKKEIDDFFKKSGPKKLNDVLRYKTGSDFSIKKINIKIDDKNNIAKISLEENKKSMTSPLLKCPSTGFKYFYAQVPISYINNDECLQPRPLEIDRLWDLYRHLLINSQLTPSVCRLTDGVIYLFDGQHKAAAQVWAGRKKLDCKIYIEPSIKNLK